MSNLLKVWGDLKDLFSPAVVPIAEEIADHPNGHKSLVLVKDGYQLKELDGETKHARTHTFDDLASLADWLNRHAAANRKGCEILADAASITANLDGTDPYSDVVTCTLTPHPLYAAWSRAFGKEQKQKELHKFLRGVLDSFDVTSEVNFGEQLASQIRKVEVRNNQEVKAEIAPTGYFRVQVDGSGAEVVAEIPPTFTIHVPIFAGVCQVVDGKASDDEVTYSLDVMVSIDLAEKGVVFQLDCPTLPTILHQARKDAIEYLRALLDDDFLVGLGKHSVVPKPVVDRYARPTSAAADD